ncbi:hypothetical protein HOLleu_27695 [Holothuria leucospilota]|uniref:Uncharacterized protein n=1 Tax=Holothuria leucospilota TaxID=206669 RepID=A0A9Q1BR65_HOLLE|nr:hypothetical protein HOLleu_27695 [Holothuria leucospilota]
MGEDICLPSVNGVFFSKDIPRSAIVHICSYQCFITKWLMEEHLTMEAVYSHQAKLSFIQSKGTAELLSSLKDFSGKATCKRWQGKEVFTG